MKSKKSSKKIGFWYVCFLFSVLVMVNPHEARSNSFVDSLKGFFSNDNTTPAKDQSAPAARNTESQASTQVAPSTPQSEAGSESGQPQSEVQVIAKKGALRSEADIWARLTEEPDNAEYLFELGQMKLLQGDIAEARTHFEKIRALSNNVGLALTGLSMTELMLGNLAGAYSVIVSVPTIQDPLVLLQRSYCEFLLGQKGAGDRIVQNAAKVSNQRLSTSILASYYAISGDHDLAKVSLSKIEQSGFLYPQALVAKYLSDIERGEEVFSDLRNKYQLKSSVANLIVGNAQLLSFDYEGARISFSNATEGASTQIKDALELKLKQLNNVSEDIFLNLHERVLILAIERKNKSLFQKNIMGKSEALARLLFVTSKKEGRNNEFLDLFNSNYASLVDVEKFNSYLIETITSNRFLKQAKESKDRNEKKVAARLSVDLWGFYIFQAGKLLPEDEITSIATKVIKSQDKEFESMLALEAIFSFFYRYKFEKREFDEIRKIYKDKASVFQFGSKFFDVARFAEVRKQDKLNQDINDYLKRSNQGLELSMKLESEMKNQVEGLKMFNGFKEDESLTYEKATSRLSELAGAGCLKDSINYYLAKRFKKETAKIYQQYQTCLKGMSAEEQFLEQSVGVLVETLYLYKEYGAIIKFFEANEVLTLRASPFSVVHYIDSIGRSGDISLAKKETGRLCSKVPSNICTQINLEVIPQLDQAHRFNGMTEAAKLLIQIAPMMDKKNYTEAKRLLKQARELDPINPFIYMYYEAIYRADKSFDFLSEYTNLVSHYLTAGNIDAELRERIIDRIFRPCEDINLPCEILVSVIEDGHFKEVPKETIQPAYAAQLIRNGLMEKATAVIDEMTKSSNLTLQRKGIILKASLTEILKQVEQRGSFDKNMIPVEQPTSV